MSKPNKLALLIGVDFYTESPLTTCVADVDMIEQYLRYAGKKQNIQLRHVERLTASNPDSGATHTMERPFPSTWPTFGNLRASLLRISEIARAGDQVYVHFSGHGVGGTGPFGIALLNENIPGQPETLRGTKLAEMMGELVDMGLKVLLVLDCCFSGGVERHGHAAGTIRSIEYNPAYDPDASTTRTSSPDPDSNCDGDALRGASANANWLVNPQGYTIFTACGGDQTTGTVTIEDHKHGALTNIFIISLRRAPHLGLNYTAIYKFVCALYAAKKLPGVPQLKGNSDLSFFGFLRGPRVAFFPVIKSGKGDPLRLHAGAAIGVCEGQPFALHNLRADVDVLRAAPETVVQHGTLVAYAKEVGGTMCELDFVDQNYECVGTSWIALPLTTKRVAGGSAASSTLAAEVMDVDFEPTAMTSARFRGVTGHLGDIEVQRHNGERIILGGSPRAHTAGSTGSTKAGERLRRVLTHLERRFDVAEQICPQEDAALQSSVRITVRVEGSLNEELHDNKTIKVAHLQDVVIEIVNRYEAPVYVHVFSLPSDWSVVNLIGEQSTRLAPQNIGEGQYSRMSFTINMTMDEPEPLPHADDLFKIFITTRPAPLGDMAMPPLSEVLLDGPDRGDAEVAGLDIRDLWFARSLRVLTMRRADIIGTNTTGAAS